MFCGRATGDGVVSFGPPQAENVERTLDFLHSPPQVKKFWISFWVKMMPYIHIFYTASRSRKKIGFFFGSKWCNIYIYIFFTQPAAGKKNFGVVLGQNSAIYTHFEVFWGSKMVPYIYTFWFFFWSKCCHIYIHISGI
jgi:hypothetical protein